MFHDFAIGLLRKWKSYWKKDAGNIQRKSLNYKWLWTKPSELQKRLLGTRMVV